MKMLAHLVQLNCTKLRLSISVAYSASRPRSGPFLPWYAVMCPETSHSRHDSRAMAWYKRTLTSCKIFCLRNSVHTFFQCESIISWNERLYTSRVAVRATRNFSCVWLLRRGSQKMRFRRTDEMPIRVYREAQDVRLLSQQCVNNSAKLLLASKRGGFKSNEKTYSHMFCVNEVTYLVHRSNSSWAIPRLAMLFCWNFLLLRVEHKGDRFVLYVSNIIRKERSSLLLDWFSSRACLTRCTHPNRESTMSDASFYSFSYFDQNL